MRFVDVLDFAPVWLLSRRILDATFGVYRKRLAIIREWNSGEGSASVLDVACGVGQFAEVTTGRYMGIDTNPRFVSRARLLYGRRGAIFEEMDVSGLASVVETFDVVLLIGILHHLGSDAADQLLADAQRLARDALVLMEVVAAQSNAVGHWIMENDRGDFVRTEEELRQLISRAGFRLLDERVVYLGPTRTTAMLWEPAQAQPHPGP